MTLTRLRSAKAFAALSLMIVICGCGCKKSDRSEELNAVFRPIPGEFGGGPVADNLVVTAIDAVTGKPLRGAFISIYQGDPATQKGCIETDKEGKADFSGLGIYGPITITAACQYKETYDPVTFCDLDNASISLPLTLRKAAPEKKVKFSFTGLEDKDYRLCLYMNEKCSIDKTLINEKGRKIPILDPYPCKIMTQETALNGFILEKSGRIIRKGYMYLEKGAAKAAPHLTFDFSPADDASKITVMGKIDPKPANLNLPADGWIVHEDYRIEAASDCGAMGYATTGVGIVEKDLSYTSEIIRPRHFKDIRLTCRIADASNKSSEMAVAFTRMTEMNPITEWNPQFANVPKLVNVQINFQDMIHASWTPGEGNLILVRIFHPKYDYLWQIFALADRHSRQIDIPLPKVGSPGRLLANETYHLSIETWMIPDISFKGLKFSDLFSKATQSSRSASIPFSVN